jgi:hypothetical protein
VFFVLFAVKKYFLLNSPRLCGEKVFFLKYKEAFFSKACVKN